MRSPLTSAEREQRWHLLSLRMDGGEIPTRAEMREHVAACGDPPDWFEHGALLGAVLRGEQKSNKRRPRHPIGRLMAQTLLVHDVRAAVASVPRGQKQAVRDSLLKGRGVSLNLYEKWARPNPRDPQCWTRVALHAGYHMLGRDVFERQMRARNPDARL